MSHRRRRRGPWPWPGLRLSGGRKSSQRRPKKGWPRRSHLSLHLEVRAIAQQMIQGLAGINDRLLDLCDHGRDLQLSCFALPGVRAIKPCYRGREMGPLRISFLDAICHSDCGDSSSDWCPCLRKAISVEWRGAAIVSPLPKSSHFQGLVRDVRSQWIEDGLGDRMFSKLFTILTPDFEVIVRRAWCRH